MGWSIMRDERILCCSSNKIIEWKNESCWFYFLFFFLPREGLVWKSFGWSAGLLLSCWVLGEGQGWRYDQKLKRDERGGEGTEEQAVLRQCKFRSTQLWDMRWYFIEAKKVIKLKNESCWFCVVLFVVWIYSGLFSGCCCAAARVSDSG